MSQRKRSRSRSKSRKEKSKGEKVEKPQSKGMVSWMKKRKHKKGPLAAVKLPTVPKYPQNQLSLHKTNRIKDWALIEEEYLTATGGIESRSHCLSQKDRDFIEKLRGQQLEWANGPNGPCPIAAA